MSFTVLKNKLKRMAYRRDGRRATAGELMRTAVRADGILEEKARELRGKKVKKEKEK